MKSRLKPVTPPPQPTWLTPEEAIAAMPKTIILDVQNPRYAISTIPHAKLLNVDISINQIPKTQPILLVCLDGQRSWTAARKLAMKGYVSVSVLKGGAIGWRRAGYTMQRLDNPA